MQNKIQKGGIFIKDKKPKEAIEDFIKKCKNITLLSKNSSSGIVFECTLKDDADSPYEMLRSPNYKSPVKKIIVKLVAIGEGTEAKRLELPKIPDMPYISNFRPKKFERADTFMKEVNIQTDLFLNSISLLNPWCPSPVYASIEKENALAFINMMHAVVISKEADSDYDTYFVLNGIITSIKTGTITSLGILGMEIADGYVGLYMVDYYCKKKIENWDINLFKQYENMARLCILDMARESGYSQGDYHTGNILVNPTIEGYYNGVAGNVLIIDFGLANKIPNDKLGQIKELVEKNEFVQALKVLNTLSRSDGPKLSEFPEHYGWLSYDYDNLTRTETSLNKTQIAAENAKLLELKNKKIEADEARKESNSELPLTLEEVKSSFFQGIQSPLKLDEVEAHPTTVFTGIQPPMESDKSIGGKKILRSRKITSKYTKRKLIKSLKRSI